MPFSEVQISNMALGRIGVLQGISSLSSASNEARACSLFYEPARDAVLRDFQWPFARKYFTLGLVDEFEAGDPEVNHWAYSYRVPSDCIAVRRLVSPLGRNTSAPIVFELGSDGAGLLIYTNEADAVLEYTGQFTNPAFFPPDFATALSWRLAVDISMPLAISASIRQAAEAMYRDSVSKAGATSLGEGRDDLAPESEFIRVRA